MNKKLFTHNNIKYGYYQVFIIFKIESLMADGRKYLAGSMDSGSTIF